MDMKKRKRRVERKLDPIRKRRGRVGSPEISIAPLPEEQKPRWNRVKQSALSDEHRKRQAFPGDGLVSLKVHEVRRVLVNQNGEKLKSHDAAIEKKAGDGEESAPAKERVEGGERREKADPDQAGNQFHMKK